MKTLLSLILVVFGTQVSVAQYAISGDPKGGTPMTAVNYVSVKGNPYLLPYWAEGKVREGDTFHDLLLQYDMVRDKLAFIARSGYTMEFSKPVAYFEVLDTVKAEIRKFKRAPGGGYYEILVNGKNSLYKKVTKSVIDGNNFGTANASKTILESVTYYLVEGDNVEKLKLNKSSFVKLFDSQSVVFEKFISENDINFKNENDIVRLVNLFNRLHQDTN